MLMGLLHGMHRMCSNDGSDYHLHCFNNSSNSSNNDGNNNGHNNGWNHRTYFHNSTTAGVQVLVRGQCKVMGQEVYVGEVPRLC